MQKRKPDLIQSKEDKPIITHKKLFDDVLQCEKPFDCLSLYIMIHSEMQYKGLTDSKTIKNNIMKKSKMSQGRYKKALDELKKIGIVECHVPRNKKGRITGSFYKLKQI